MFPRHELNERFPQIACINWPKCSRDVLSADTGPFSLETGLKRQTNFVEAAELP